MTLDIELGQKLVVVTVHYTIQEGQAETRTDPPYPTTIEISSIEHKREDIQDIITDEILEHIENQLYDFHGLEY